MTTNEHLWQRAASFSARAHQHVMRKDGVTPYSAHPMRVALTVRHLFGCDDEVALAAALLHDTIEDTGADFEKIEDRFGREVAELVAALTKDASQPKPIRERAYDERLRQADWRARLVKLADQYDNLTDALSVNGMVPKTIPKARRAMKQAEADVEAHPETRRAIEALGELVRVAEARDGAG